MTKNAGRATSGRPLALAALALVATAALAFGFSWLLSGAGSQSPGGADAPPVPLSPRAPGPVGWSIAAGEAVALDHDELPDTGKVGIELLLVEPSADAKPLGGRILSFDAARENRERPLEAAVVGDDRARARVDVPVDFLIPDVYLIEIKTTEKNALPVRRYRLEVR